MTIQFDDGAADALVSALTAGANTLRGQAGSRRSAVEDAAEHFSGGYARRFIAACTVEAEDRATLAGKLDDLTDQVREAKTKATEEKARIVAHDAWQAREDERQRQRTTKLLSGTPDLSPEPFDPEPSDTPIAPPEVSAGFAARTRDRSAGGGSAGGKSSADPAQLRAFATNWRAGNDALASEHRAVQSAWTSFTSSCSWVPAGSSSFLTGFQNLLMESQADAAWAETIAEAFERAGGGSLSDADLNLMWAAKIDPVGTQEAMEKLTKAEREKLTLFEAIMNALKNQVTLPGDPLGLMLWVTEKLQQGTDAATKLVRDFKYGRLAPRVNGRFVPKADTRVGQGTQARTPSNLSAKPGAAAARADWAKGAKWASRAGWVVAGVTGGVNQWAQDEGAGYNTSARVGRATTSALGNGAGAAGGAWAGAQVGAMIGSLGGPVGTLVGGIAGGLIGGIIGSGIGDWAADQLMDGFDYVGSHLDDIGDALTFWD